MARRGQALAVSVLPTLVAFVLTHQAIFLYTYGRDFEAALSRTGHGRAWATTVVLVLALGAGLILVGAAEFARLAHRARLLDRQGLISSSPAPAPADSVRSLASDMLRTTGRIAGGVALLLVLMENVEHALAGAAMPGISVFDGPEYQGSVPLLLTFSFAVAAVRALYRWRRSSLVARLRAARIELPHPPLGSVRRPPDARITRGALIGRRLAGRAPPVPAAA